MALGIVPISNARAPTGESRSARQGNAEETDFLGWQALCSTKILGRFKMCKRSVKRDCSFINTCLAGRDSELEMGISGRNQEFQAFLINEHLLGRKNLLWPQLQCREEATN